jgi:hypothetical protein
MALLQHPPKMRERAVAQLESEDNIVSKTDKSAVTFSLAFIVYTELSTILELNTSWPHFNYSCT